MLLLIVFDGYVNEKPNPNGFRMFNWCGKK